MNAQTPKRGLHLVAPRGGWLAKLVSGPFHRILNRVDEGLAVGSLEAMLPDGTFRILGSRAPGPVAVVSLNKWRALIRLARSGSVGWYEAWAAGEWSSADPVPLFDLFMRNRATLDRAARARGTSRIAKRIRHALRANDRRGAKRNILAHYDLGNDFYAAWLDPTMTYSSALFADPADASEALEAAQQRKMAAMLDRLALVPGATLLEIGCGWGGLLAAASRRDLIATGLTLSPSQKRHTDALLDGRATVLLADYRDASGAYDGIASVEMVEAVGQRYWPAFLDTIVRCLKPGGRAAIQLIFIADDIFERYATSADFIQTYIFPGGMLVSQGRFRALAEARGLEWRDQNDFGLHYAETLRRWLSAFDEALASGRLPTQFDARFVALWRYYLMYCEGGFRGAGITVAQVTLVKSA